MEPNPYEAPKVPKPSTEAVIKRSIGAGLILLLTPIAVAVAFGISCGATMGFLSTSVFGQNYGLVSVVAWSIFLIPPAAVFVGMIWWAIRARMNRRQSSPQKVSPDEN